MASKLAQPAKTPTNALDGEHVRVREQDDELKGERKDDQGRFLYWARRMFDYGPLTLDRGQIFALVGLRNDSKLNRQGFLTALRRTDQVFPCRHCAAQFVDLNTLNGHGDRRHRDRSAHPDVPFSPRGATVDDSAAEAQQLEKDQRHADQVAPLNFDKTEAARGARA